MGVIFPSIESPDLTIVREIVPHATSSEGKRHVECSIKGRHEGGETKEKNSKDMQSE
jgi:hypothetical protein